MKNQFTATASINIKASASQVWKALTDPEIVKQYFFGVDVISDWKKGSPILYRGVWEGKAFEDKGNILEIIPEKLLLCNYWSSFSGTEDIPENYQNVHYELTGENGGAKLTITQDRIPTEEQKAHTEKNWNYVLEAMKKLLEK
jgi:uncharacterized protein YndB with AHSA1/START domain